MTRVDIPVRARALARLLVRHLDRVHDIALDLDRDNPDLHIAPQLAYVRDRARDLYRAVDPNSDISNTRVRALARGIARDLDHIRDRARAINAFVIDIHLVETARTAGELLQTMEVLELTEEASAPPEVTAGAAARSPGRTVSRLIAVAAWLLPVAHRARYGEEFRAEVGELPRRARPSYALRLIGSAPALRRGLGDGAAERVARAGRSV